MGVAERVSITCESCQAAFTVPLQDIPEDATLTAVARDFLAEHTSCSISIQVHGGHRPE